MILQNELFRLYDMKRTATKNLEDTQKDLASANYQGFDLEYTNYIISCDIGLINLCDNRIKKIKAEIANGILSVFYRKTK